MYTYSELTGRPLPKDLEGMRPAAADKWLAEAWELWRGHKVV